MPRAEAPLTEAAPSKIGEPVGCGLVMTPVEATGAVGTPVPTGKPADGAGTTTDGTSGAGVASHS